MNRIKFFIPLLVALLIAAIFTAQPVSFAQAQTAPTQEPVCRDAAGGVIPCPPTPQPEMPTSVPTSAPANPTSAPSNPTAVPPTATATATATPTEEPGTRKAEWSGVCKDTTCIAQFTNGCEYVGGTVEVGKIEGGEVPLTCKVPMGEYEPEIALAAAPTEDTSTAKGASWSGTCKGSVREVARCIGLFHNGCKHVGGKVSDTIENGEVNLTCTVPSTVDPGSQFAAADDSRPNEDGYLGSCSGKNLAECRKVFVCENGLLVIKVDLYASGGTRYDFYCIPHDGASELPFAIQPSDGENDNWTGGCSGPFMDQCIDTLSAMCDEEGGDLSVWYDDGGTGAGLYCENMSEAGQLAPTEAPLLAAVPQEPSEPEPTPAPTFPPGGWLPWMTGFLGLLIGLLLPAVQKVREAAARSGQTREHVLLNKEDDGDIEPEQAGIPNLTDKPDGGSTEHKDWIHIQSISQDPDSGASSGAMPQTKEHVLLNKDNEPQADDEPTIKNKEEDGSTEASYLKIGDIKGESSGAQADDTPTIKNKEEDGGTEAGYLRFDDVKGESRESASPAPQTREHILLANQDADTPKDAAARGASVVIIDKKGK